MNRARTRPQTREAWLLELVDLLRPLFARHKASIPERVRVSCGWTGKGARAKRVGECWAGKTAADGCPHIYISPVVGDTLTVAAILVHELVHATLGAGQGHGKEFGRVARRLGLEGPLRTTHAGPVLVKVLDELVQGGLGQYPHAAVTAGEGPQKKQTTRMYKLVCPSDGYLVRTTQKWLEVGAPVCPCGVELELETGRLSSRTLSAELELLDHGDGR